MRSARTSALLASRVVAGVCATLTMVVAAGPSAASAATRALFTPELGISVGYSRRGTGHVRVAVDFGVVSSWVPDASSMAPSDQQLAAVFVNAPELSGVVRLSYAQPDGVLGGALVGVGGTRGQLAHGHSLTPAFRVRAMSGFETGLTRAGEGPSFQRRLPIAVELGTASRRTPTGAPGVERFLDYPVVLLSSEWLAPVGDRQRWGSGFNSVMVGGRGRTIRMTVPT